MKRLLFCWLLLPFAAAAQVQSCNWNQTVTGAVAGTSQPNDTVSPNCNAFALTWTSTGFTALTIQLEGSHVSGSGFTAFSGASTVVAGTSNPTSALSGVIIVQAQTKIAFLRFNITSVTGSGSIQTQLKGFSGISAAASAAQAGSGTSWANITPGTNNKGFFQCQAPCVIEPTAIGGGGIYGTQLVDGNDLPALTISTPGGPAIDFANIATSVGGGGATVAFRAIGADSNVNLDLLAKGSGVLHLGSNSASVDNAGALTVASCTGCSGAPTGAAGGDLSGTYPNPTVAQVNGAVVPLTAPVVASNASRQLIAATTTGTGSTVVLAGGPALTLANATGLPAGGLASVAADNIFGNFTAGAAIPGTQAIPSCAADGVHGLTYPSHTLTCTTISTGGGSGGGGVSIWSANVSFTGAQTRFAAFGGGFASSATEASAQGSSPATATVANLYVVLGSAPGGSDSVTYTLRLNGADTPITCQISAAAKTCNDTTHSVNVAAGDLLDWKLVSSNTLTLSHVIGATVGTSGVGVTSVSGTSPITVTSPTTTPVIACATCLVNNAANTGTAAMTLDLSASTTTNALKAPVKAGATATANGGIAYDSTNNMMHAAQSAADAMVPQFTATPANNDCAKWTVSGGNYKLDTAGAVCGGGGAFPLTIVQEANFNSGQAASNVSTIAFPQTAAASGNTLFMMIATDGAQTFNIPSGWTVDLNTAQANNSRFVLMHKASASDTSVTFTGVTDLWAGFFVEFSGTHALDQSTIAGQAITATGQYVFSAITPTANSVVFAFVALTNGSGFLSAQGTLSNIFNPAWTPLYSSNSVTSGGRYLIGYVSRVAATNTSTKPPSIITYASTLAASGAVVTTFSIL